MRVLLLNYEYPPLGGGAATATMNLLKEYSNRIGIDVTLVTSSVGGYHEEQIGENIKICFLDINKKGDLHNQSLKDLLKYSLQCSKWLAKNKNDYDLIHAFFGVPCGFLAMLTGKPYIVSLRGSDVPFYSEKFKKLDKFVFQYLDKIIWKKAKYVIANSEGLRDLAYKTYNKKKIDVIYNGVDIDKYYPSKKFPQKFIVVSTSRLIERKGLDYLIKAFKDFSRQKEDSELRFYGDGAQANELKQLTENEKIARKVHFYGDTSREKLQEELRKSSVFVLPSLNEGMSNALLEAMASGLPVIATDVGGTKELVNGDNGFVIRQKNVKDIQDALEKLYLDNKLRVNMGRRSREKAEKMSWKNMADSYLSLYKKV